MEDQEIQEFKVHQEDRDGMDQKEDMDFQVHLAYLGEESLYQSQWNMGDMYESWMNTLDYFGFHLIV